MAQQNITIQTRPDSSQGSWNDGMVKTTASQVAEETNRKFITNNEKLKVQSLPLHIDGVTLTGQNNLNRLYTAGDPNNSITKNLVSINGIGNNIPLTENGTSIYAFMVNGHTQSSMILVFDNGTPYPVKYFGNSNSTIMEHIKPNTIIEFEFYDNSWNIMGALDNTDIINTKLTSNDPITPGIATKIIYDSKGLVVGAQDLIESDIPEISIEKITDLRAILDGILGDTRIDTIMNILETKITANSDIIAATNTKITYDNKGLITGGSNLIESDIPIISISKVSNLNTELANKVEKNVAITGGTFTKVTFDNKGLITAGMPLLQSDIPALDISKITILQTTLNSKVNGNAPITSGTNTKIAYDEKGLVVGGANLTEADVPQLSIAKVIGLTEALANTGSMESIENLQSQILIKVDRNDPITAGSAAKVSFDSKGLITGALSLVASDIPKLTISSIINLQDTLDGKITSNPVITGATSAKVTYDSKGLITNSSALLETDIPNLGMSKIIDLQTNLNNKAETSTLNQVNAALENLINTKVTTNIAISPGTATKITYDEKGLITLGGELNESDIPLIGITKVDGLDAALSNKTDIYHASTENTYGVASETEYGHAMAGSTVMPLGEAEFVGTDNGKYAREDHIHSIDGIAGDASSVNGFTFDQDVKTTASPTFVDVEVDKLNSSGDIEITDLGNFIVSNDQGYMARLSDNSLINLISISELDVINLGFDNRPIIINTNDIRLGNNSRLATMNDLPVIPSSLPADGGNADTVNNFQMDQDVTTLGDPTFNTVTSRNTINSRSDIIITETGDFVVQAQHGYMGTHLEQKLNLISVIDEVIEIGQDEFPVKFTATAVRLGNGARIASIDDIPLALPADGGNADTVNDFQLDQDVTTTGSPTFVNVTAGNIDAVVQEITDARQGELSLSENIAAAKQRINSLGAQQQTTPTLQPYESNIELYRRVVVHDENDNIYALYSVSGGDYYLDKTSNNGVLWERKGLLPSNLSQLTKISKTGTLIGVEATASSTISYPKIYRSTDDGANWESISVLNFPALSPQSIVETPSGAIVIGEYGTVSNTVYRILRSIDDGITWEVVLSSSGTDPDGDAGHFHSVTYDPYNSKLVTFSDRPSTGTDGPLIYTSSDDGATWDLLGVVTVNTRPNFVTLMYFEDYIAWGSDNERNGVISRISREDFYAGNFDEVEDVAQLNKKVFYYTFPLREDVWAISMATETVASATVPEGPGSYANEVFIVSDNGKVVSGGISQAQNTLQPGVLPGRKITFPSYKYNRLDHKGMSWMNITSGFPRANAAMPYSQGFSVPSVNIGEQIAKGLIVQTELPVYAKALDGQEIPIIAYSSDDNLNIYNGKNDISSGVQLRITSSNRIGVYEQNLPVWYVEGRKLYAPNLMVTTNDVGIYGYGSNPNGNVTARMGSICVNWNGGKGVSIWVKETTSGDTGWVPVGVASGSTDARPTITVVGMMYFDTVLGKPIWCKTAGEIPVWVDATGTTV